MKKLFWMVVSAGGGFLFGSIGWSLVVYVSTKQEATDAGAAVAGIVAGCVAVFLLLKKYQNTID